MERSAGTVPSPDAVGTSVSFEPQMTEQDFPSFILRLSPFFKQYRIQPDGVCNIHNFSQQKELGDVNLKVGENVRGSKCHVSPRKL